MAFPQWFAGQRITAERLNARNDIMVEQGVNQTDTSGTMVNTNISANLVAGALYTYELYIGYIASVWDGSDGGISWIWTPTSAVRDRHDHFIARNNTSTSASVGHPYMSRTPAPTTVLTAGGADGGYRSIVEYGKFDSSVATTVTLQFCVGAAGSGATCTLADNTWLLYRRIA